LIKYIHFNQQFNVQLLQQEVAALETALWKEHYNRSNYEGSWTTIQLRAINGDAGNNTAIQPAALGGALAFKDTALLQQCPYINEVIAFFKIEKTAVRLMKLDAGAVIKPHRDHDLNFEQGEVRLHIPVSTNAQVTFLLEEEALPLTEGSCWYLNLSLTHSVRNESDSNRVHLVIDGLVNDWLKDFFSLPAHQRVDCKEGEAGEQHSPEDKQKIIAALRLMQTPLADQLANDMEAGLEQPGI
jgi:Aspartyl/Asparaginyl beta-hydroxylase